LGLFTVYFAIWTADKTLGGDMKSGYHDHFCEKCGHGFICPKVTHCNEPFEALCPDHRGAYLVVETGPDGLKVSVKERQQ